MIYYFSASVFFFFNDTATTEIYTLSLHDALPIYCFRIRLMSQICTAPRLVATANRLPSGLKAKDRKSTRLNSSHSQISYAVFCLKKKRIAAGNDLAIVKKHEIDVAMRI